MLNNAELVAQLGYNVKILESGFNSRNRSKRKTPFHGETLKHLLASAKAEEMIQWFNGRLRLLWQEQAEKASGAYRTEEYILDGMEIEVPAHLVKKYEGAGTVKREDGTFAHGYKVVWIQEVFSLRKNTKYIPKGKDNKQVRTMQRGAIVALRIGPIQEHDLSLAKWLVSEFQFEPWSNLIMDRGFVDGEWFNHLKEERKINVYVPLKRNMKITKDVVLRGHTERKDDWKPHPTREEQWVLPLKEEELKAWKECLVLRSGVLVKWKNKKDGSFEEVLFVTTQPQVGAERLLFTYDQRASIEETHRQLKQNQGIETLPSTKWEHVVFRIIMGAIANNLMNLFLLDECCEDLKEVSLKTMRQKRFAAEERNPEVIVYTEEAFAVIRQLDLMRILIDLENRKAKSKLRSVFSKMQTKDLEQSTAFG
jgi:hypothetical protein